LWRIAGEAEGELGGFVDGIDDGAVGKDGAVKIWPARSRRLLLSVEVVGEHVRMPGIREGRRREASSERGFSMGRSLLFFQEENGVMVGGEVLEMIAVAESEEAGADGGFLWLRWGGR